jgi:hypothetical protein
VKLRTFILLVLFGVASLAYIGRPGTMYLKVEGFPWKEIKVLSLYGKPMAFREGKAARIWPMAYGKYKISVEFADGKTLWLTYYHYDAGVRKRVDLTIKRLSPSTVDILQVYNRTDKIERIIAFEESSEEKPLQVDGPA